MLKDSNVICMLTTPRFVFPAQTFPLSLGEQIQVPVQHPSVNIRCFKPNLSKTECLSFAPKIASSWSFSLSLRKWQCLYFSCVSLKSWHHFWPAFLSDIALYPSIPHSPEKSCKIYPESEHFSPLQLLPSCSNPPSSLGWIVITASSLVSLSALAPYNLLST